MFSGIIEGTGQLKSCEQRNDSHQLAIQADFALDDMNIGESIAVNGCCLTVTSRLGNTFWADLSEETLRVTTLGKLTPGAAVNLERALRYGGRVGGHLVQGHVDGVGRIAARNQLEHATEFVVELPLPLTRYIIERGSIAVDGVSLTAARVQSHRITIYVIPHTGLVTTFASLAVGDAVNLEVDLISKYVEKLASIPAETFHAHGELSLAFQKKFGF